eukprot:scaffold71499_cov63-Phaeocystis_antarctica.AAC.1
MKEGRRGPRCSGSFPLNIHRHPGQRHMLLRGGMPLASPVVASEDLRVVPAATGMHDREVAGVEFMDAPLADLDRVIADGDSIWCAQCRASVERVVLKSSCHVGQGDARFVASEDL